MAALQLPGNLLAGAGGLLEQGGEWLQEQEHIPGVGRLVGTPLAAVGGATEVVGYAAAFRFRAAGGEVEEAAQSLTQSTVGLAFGVGYLVFEHIIVARVLLPKEYAMDPETWGIVHCVWNCWRAQPKSWWLRWVPFWSVSAEKQTERSRQWERTEQFMAKWLDPLWEEDWVDLQTDLLANDIGIQLCRNHPKGCKCCCRLAKDAILEAKAKFKTLWDEDRPERERSLKAEEIRKDGMNKARTDIKAGHKP